MKSAFGKILRIGEKKALERYSKLVNRVNDLEGKFESMNDQYLSSVTADFRQRMERGESQDEILPEAFAAVREAAKRTLGQRHFDVQIMGGAVLHEGKISEMKTGEGKTLVSTLPAYLNALAGKGVHLITVNDYLAKRDSEWMGTIHRFLGLEVGLIQHDSTNSERQEAYLADITYGTNNEFGFDYLRDNLKTAIEDMAQRGHNYAIVDEVDSVLIDEARTPLIISGPVTESVKLYGKFARLAPQMKRDMDYTVEEKTRTVSVTEDGVKKIERLIGVDNLYDEVNTSLVHQMQNAIKARELFKRDIDYVVKDGEIIIVDEFTGRLMPGRRWSDGLHQAVEAKEGVRIRQENQTVATITLQNYFRMYDKLAGMTGTALTEANEFNHTYGLEVVAIPTNKTMIRADNPDVIYKTEDSKFGSIVEDIEDCQLRGQPVLVGTISIEKSERISKMLTRKGIKHNVLNAKYHDREAEIIAQAGRKGAVTISTNMAGRGTDIMLGGNPDLLALKAIEGQAIEDEEEADRLIREMRDRCDREKEEVIEAGGLHVIGTERHEARRIDNQLRGRSGRQGDPGSSRFFLSLEDDLMRIFAADRIKRIMERFNVPEEVPIENKMVTKAIESAQKNVETNNFEARKNLLKYDDVMNMQREAVYGDRKNILKGEDLSDKVPQMIRESVEDMVRGGVDEKAYPEDWDLEQLFRDLKQIFPLTFGPNDLKVEDLTVEMLIDAVEEDALELYEKRIEEFKEKGEDISKIERYLMLRVVDNNWQEFLYEMDYLKEGIGLRAMGGRDPLVEFKAEAYELFQQMVLRVKEEFLSFLFRIKVLKKEERRVPVAAQARVGAGGDRKKKIGRNEPCPCGSGKKYKVCCGR